MANTSKTSSNSSKISNQYGSTRKTSSNSGNSSKSSKKCDNTSKTCSNSGSSIKLVTDEVKLVAIRVVL